MLKEEVEQFLNTYAIDHPGLSVNISKTGTRVYKNNIFQMSIYYRIDAVRIEIKPGTTQHGEYESLLQDQLIYQRDSANPYSSLGRISFFVDERNIVCVLKRLIESQSFPTSEQMDLYALNSQQYKAEKKQRQLYPEYNTTALVAPNGGTSNFQREVVVQTSESNHRIEKKLDSLIGAIATIYSEKSSAAVSDVPLHEETDKRYRIETTQGDAPMLMLKSKSTINGLIFTLKLYAVGLEKSIERYRIFFTNINGELLSEPQEIDVVASKEYNCRFELKSSASEEKKVFLAIQGINAVPEEVRQLIGFNVKIAFAADFGL